MGRWSRGQSRAFVRAEGLETVLLKHDGFRALAIVDGHQCRLVPPRGHVFKQWPQLARELAHTVKAGHAVLDGEVVCLRPDGSSDFTALLFRRDPPYFYGFD